MSKRSHTIFIATLFVLTTALSSGVEPSAFELNFAAAQANLESKHGAAYDKSLKKVINAAQMKARSSDGITMSTCIRKVVYVPLTRGYFYFTSATSYSVELIPKGPFSECVTQVFEGHIMPPPPTIPYLHAIKIDFPDSHPPGATPF